MVNEKDKNEMIAEWVGFKERYTSGKLSYWWEFNGYPFTKCPDFMNSETACFRFIIPALREKGYGIDITMGRAGAFVNIWNLHEKQEDDSMNTTAIGINTHVSSAICMAVLELMRTEQLDCISGLWHS